MASTLAASAGGLLYGFSPYMFAQSLGHLHLILAVFPPLVMILLSEILGLQKRSPVLMGSLLGALTAAQLLVGEEIVAATAIAAATAVVWLVLLRRFRIRSYLRYAAISLAAAAVVAGLLAAVPMWFQFFGPRAVHGAVQPHNFYVTDLLNFVVPTLFMAIKPAALVDLSVRWTGNSSEWNAYLGAPLVLLLLGTLAVSWRSAVVRMAGLVGLSMAVLSLGPRLHVGGVDTGVHLPYRALDRLPVLGNVLPSRLALFVYLAAGLVLAVFLRQALSARYKPAAVAGLAAIGGAGCLCSPALPWYSRRRTSPPFFTSAARAGAAGQLLMVLPAYGPDSPRPMLWQAAAGMRYRMPAGYIFVPGAGNAPALGPRPSAFSDLLAPIADGAAPPSLDPARRAAVLADLSSRGVVGVVVGPMGHQAESVATLTDLFGRAPEEDGGVYAWWLK